MSRRLASNQGILFNHQSQLSKLPVPSLAETCSKFIETAKPLATEQELKQCVKAIEELQKPGSLGPVLQQRLQKRAEIEPKGWFADWWLDYAYMGYRDSVVINVNYFFAFKDDPIRRIPAERAASIISGAMQFRDLAVTEELEPESTKSGKLCSEQYKYLFNSTRIPNIPSDITRNSDPTVNNHIIIIRKNQFYKLDLVHGNGKRLNTKEIQKQLEYIYKYAGEEPEAPVGALTSENRDVWTNVRKELLSLSDKNKKSLDIIETAAFVVCLDDSKPITKEEHSIACWHGDGRNRFFDKSMQFIVFDNGKAGFNGEHSRMEATITHRACDYICKGLKANTINHGEDSVSDMELPQKLNFDLNPRLYTAISKATERFDADAAKRELVVASYKRYGKNAIKKLEVSPDAYAQMAIQLAYYKMYGTCRATYETSGTRKFYHGRTEAGRSVSVESVAFVKAMCDPKISPKEKGILGRKAIKTQSAYMATSADGHGIDRHFLGLSMLVKDGEQMPSIYNDPVFKRTKYWVLSTSQVTSEFYDGYGWGEVVSDGYGIAYMVKNNSLQFNIVSQKLKNRHFETFLYEALDEMQEAFSASLPPSPPKAKM